MTKILIAEDERDIRDLISFTLSFAGYEVVAVKDGLEATESVLAEKPDLILLDVRMPRMNGYDACKKIKADTRTQDIPIAFLSAKGQDAEVQEGLDAGAVEYLLKPFAPNDLLERVQKILAQSRNPGNEA